MINGALRLQRKLKLAGSLLGAGLVVEGLTLYWANPLSFLLFIAVGGLLITLGIVVFLKAVVSQ